MKKFILFLSLALTVATGINAQVDFRHISFDEAKTAAKTEGKLIFVDFYTQWCGPCKMLAKKVFPTKEVGDYMNPRFVCLKLDAEAEGAELAKACKVEAYPTLAVFDADGNMIGSFSGYKESGEFITSVETCTNPELSPERVLARFEAGERDPRLVCAYAALMIDKNRDYMKGQEVLDEYFNTLSDTDKAKTENQYLYMQFLYSYDSPRAQYLIAHRNNMDAGKLEKVDELIQNLYLEQAYKYMTNNEINASDESRNKYKGFKSELKAKNYGPKFDDMIAIADKRSTSDDKTFIAYCDKNFDKFNSDVQGYLMSGIKTLVPIETEEQKKAASGFVRRHIAGLDATSLVSAAYTIYEIENPKH